ncbi:MAG TPA: hypothetical protein VMP11_03595 [Verrucomicrobiae bacterium]|nr:hypothetical protein [Verrucomicrobiae bacterium]
MMFVPRVGLCLAILGLVGITTKVSAVEYTYEGETGGGLPMWIETSGGNMNALVGQLVMTTSTPGWQSVLDTYCTDVAADLARSYNYSPYAFTDPQATGVDPKWTSGGIQNAAAIWYAYSASANADPTGVKEAGLQLAIWEALYNNQATYTGTSFFDSSNGGFYITSADFGNVARAANYAASYLDSLGSLAPAPNGDWLAPVDSEGAICGSQGLLYPITPPPCQQVPDMSSTFMLFGAALTALGFAGRKFQSK